MTRFCNIHCESPNQPQSSSNSNCFCFEWMCNSTNSANNLIEFLFFFLIIKYDNWVQHISIHVHIISGLKCNNHVTTQNFYMTVIKCSLVYCIFSELHVYLNNTEWKIYRKPFSIFSSMKLPYYRWRTSL